VHNFLHADPESQRLDMMREKAWAADHPSTRGTTLWKQLWIQIIVLIDGMLDMPSAMPAIGATVTPMCRLRSLGRC